MMNVNKKKKTISNYLLETISNFIRIVVDMETRIQKHLKYRAELIKEGSTTVDKKEAPRKITQTLPINTVMDEYDQNKKAKEFYEKQKCQRIILYVLLGLLLAAIITGLVFFGIYAFRGN